MTTHQSETIRHPDISTWYQVTATILIIGGVAKIFSAIYLLLIDPPLDVFLFKPGWLVTIGIYEFVAATLMTSRQVSPVPKLILAFWTGTAFLATHLFFYFLKMGACPCLGVLARGSGPVGALIHGLIIAAALYIFLGAFQHFRRELNS